MDGSQTVKSPTFGSLTKHGALYAACAGQDVVNDPNRSFKPCTAFRPLVTLAILVKRLTALVLYWQTVWTRRSQLSDRPNLATSSVVYLGTLQPSNRHKTSTPQDV